MRDETYRKIVALIERFPQEGHTLPDSVSTCGTCGRSWDNAVSTELTPTPSARCPFEYDHPRDPEKPTAKAVLKSIAATAYHIVVSLQTARVSGEDLDALIEMDEKLREIMENILEE